MQVVVGDGVAVVRCDGKLSQCDETNVRVSLNVKARWMQVV